MFLYDWTMIILIPGIILAALAQFRVNSTYRKYSQVRSRGGITGAQAAREMLKNAGLGDVAIERIPGELTDHYDPRKNVLRLSGHVYQSDSLAALGVAAHEVGHAIQQNEGYQPLAMRNAITPVAQVTSYMAIPLFLIGFLFSGVYWLTGVGIAFFFMSVLFYIITLPVEYNASNRAMANLEGTGILQRDEVEGAQKVLSAAALTYLASALMAILQLVRLMVLRDSRRR